VTAPPVAQVRVPNIDVSQIGFSRDPGDWVFAVGVLLAGVLAVLALRQAVRRWVRRTDGDMAGAALIWRFVGLGIMGVAFATAMNVLDVRGVGAIVGALGIASLAVAFALRDVLENLVAGIVLQSSRPFRTGDVVESNGYEGVVLEVTLRAVRLRTVSGEIVTLPSAAVIRTPLVNRSREDVRRTDVECTVPLDADVDAVRAAFVRRCAERDALLPVPAPEILRSGFGPGGIRLTARVWFDARATIGPVATDVVTAAVCAAAVDAAVTIVSPADEPAG
jgi:small conductance mechanosensitive channel